MAMGARRLTPHPPAVAAGFNEYSHDHRVQHFFVSRPANMVHIQSH
jgi:hypothetical protein